MATVARRTSGTFSSEHDELGLYTLIRVVAEFVAPDEPTLVTEAAWNAGRAPSGHAGAPSARDLLSARRSRRQTLPLRMKPLSALDILVLTGIGWPVDAGLLSL